MGTSRKPLRWSASGSPSHRQRKVTVWARVTAALGLKVVGLVPLVILALAVFNHVLRERMGSEYISHAMWLTMHLPFFLLFLYITKCSVIKMAFMILSAFTFTAPTIVVSSVVMRHFGNSQWMLLVSNLLSYALILLLVQFVFRRGFNYLIKYGDDRLFLQFSVVPFLYYLYVFSALGVDFSSLIDSGGWLVRYFPSLEVFVFYFLLLSVYRNLSEKHEIEAEQAALTQRLASSEERIAMLNESEVQTAVYQHDMRHHLNAIDGFLAAGKPQQAEEYIRKVRSDIERITPKRYCDNELVNLLCSSFAGKAQRMGVRLEVDAKLPRELSVSDTELCAVLSNALENALRAVSDQPEADRWVTLYCGVRLGKLLVEIQNPCAEGLVMRDGLPVSERAGHGYGCRSIQTIAERRGGLCEFRARGGIFSMQLVLPIKAAAKTQD